MRGFLPHLAPRGSGGSGEPSGGLGGGGPGPPVWHMVGEGEGPASGASPEAVSVVVAVAPSSTEDSTLNPSSGGAGGWGLRGVSSPRGLRRREWREKVSYWADRLMALFLSLSRSESGALTQAHRAPDNLFCPTSVLTYAIPLTHSSQATLSLLFLLGSKHSPTPGPLHSSSNHLECPFLIPSPVRQAPSSEVFPGPFQSRSHHFTPHLHPPVTLVILLHASPLRHPSHCLLAACLPASLE